MDTVIVRLDIPLYIKSPRFNNKSEQFYLMNEK
jgi:hypothetical protein